MKSMSRTLLGGFLALLSLGAFALSPVVPAEPVKVVYHFDAGLEQANKGLRNVKNHLDVDPKAKIVVVAHAQGVNFLLDGAVNATGNPFNISVEELEARGVEFRVCEITLKANKIDPKKLIPQTRIVPSGVVEIARLQAKENFVYIKP
jgi:intracellular sulfur oxidation DsrE/DsrF family protein